MRHCHVAEAFFHDKIERKLRDRIFKQRQLVFQIVELRTSYLGTALKVNPVTLQREIDMINRACHLLANLLDLDTILFVANRHIVHNDIWEFAQ